jgi:hypothetical protein
MLQMKLVDQSFVPDILPATQPEVFGRFTPCCDYAPNPGDLPTFLRHLMGSHPDLTEEIETRRQDLANMIRQEWERVFQGPLKVDFVCNNPAKIHLLRDTMAVSDLVPMIFGMDPDTNDDPTRFRVQIEI